MRPKIENTSRYVVSCHVAEETGLLEDTYEQDLLIRALYYI